MITGKQLRDSIISGANNIKNNKSAVDELNVFPVPDGDTGTNMSMTIGFAVRELQLLDDNCTVEKVSQVAASSLLRGARGNSGVILSLLFRGFAKGLSGLEQAGSKDIANSLAKGVESAYKAVMKPTEGTILTVARVAAEKAVEKAEGLCAIETFELIVNVAEQTLQQTPEMLPVLKKAGVVDAGGRGFVCIFEGMLSSLKDGKIIELSDSNETSSETASAPKGVYAEDVMSEETDSYCTEFLVIKTEEQEANAVKLRANLEAIGDSVVVVEDDELIKCHVHTKTPDKALKFALIHGYLSKIKIENMLEQFMALNPGAKIPEKKVSVEDISEFEYVKKDSSIKYGVVSVSCGDGLKQLFFDLGVDKVVSGGQTMNPSTDDILAAIQSVAAENVIVLANNKNIIMAAEQACLLADRNAVTLPTRSIPAGISAMLMFNPDDGVEQNLVTMKESAENAVVGQITFAARNSDFDGHTIKEGEILALESGKLVFTEKSISNAAVKLAKKIVSKDKSFLTVIYGSDVNEDEAEKTLELIKQKIPSNIEINLINGGQPVYYYYLSAE